MRKHGSALYYCVAAAAGFLLCLSVTGCTNSTYPREKITRSVQDLVTKECNVPSKARIVGKTLYLDMDMPGLTTTDTEALSALLKKLQGAVLSITRVALSSDAQIRFVVVQASDPAWKMSMRVVQRLQDVKDFLYQRISKADYEDRLIIEMDGKEDGEVSGDGSDTTPDESGDVSLNEFAGRLIVSQFNMMNRTNPFLSVIFSDSRLKFTSFADGELVVTLTETLNPKTEALFKSILKQETKKVVEKYKLSQLKNITVNCKNNPPFSIAFPDK